MNNFKLLTTKLLLTITLLSAFYLTAKYPDHVTQSIITLDHPSWEGQQVRIQFDLEKDHQIPGLLERIFLATYQYFPHTMELSNLNPLNPEFMLMSILQLIRSSILSPTIPEEFQENFNAFIQLHLQIRKQQTERFHFEQAILNMKPNYAPAA